MIFCQACNIHVPKLATHKKTNLHKSNCLLNTKYKNVYLIANAFRDRIASYKINSTNLTIAPELFLSEISEVTNQLIREYLHKHTTLKVNFELFVTYVLTKNDEKSMKSFNTKYVAVFQNSDIASLYRTFAETLVSKCSEFELSESGWTIETVNHLEVNIMKYNPLRAGSYIPLPQHLANKKACVNINNTDNHCFLWCIMAHLYPVKKNPQRVTSYPDYSDILETSGMTFPPNLNDIKWFERHNVDISLNIYGLTKKGEISGPLYKTSTRKLHHVNLLLLTCKRKAHFCLIKDLGKLVHNQLTKHKSKIHLCEECFLYFSTKEKQIQHNCAGIQTMLPEKDSKIFFCNFERTQAIPIVIYGDFESLLLEFSDKNKSTYVENMQIHEASCFAYYICCKSNPELNDFVSYRGPDCSRKFVESICSDVARLHAILSNSKPMIPLTPAERLSFITSTMCHICKELFSCEDKIVMDHDHFTGRYRGAAHTTCNFKAKTCPFIPIIFHNLTGYDSHLFINELSNVCGRINLIPKNKEKFISFTKFIPMDRQNVAQLKFIDSFNFLSSSLDSLVNTMKENDFQHLKSFFGEGEKFDLVRKKGIYCYDYVDCWERYEETYLPEPSHFFNRLTSESVSSNDYKHAMRVWDTFNIKNLGEYTDLYLKCDVLLLCDCFEKFRNMSLNFYNLDPCYYVSSPSLSWDAMLLYTKVKLDLLTDIEMYQMIEQGIRGGLAQCSRRYARSNNKYLLNYDPTEPDSFLVYLDCVNLYGYAMMQRLPKSNFRFLSDFEIASFDVESIRLDSDTGFILEVDLHYPSELHDYHSDMPFAAEKFIPAGSKNVKLIANLYDKHRYIIHYIHLKECLKNGLVLLKIYKILAFEQSNFLEPYISLNTSLRQTATSEFERDFFKKQNNSIFGKTIENKRKQVDVKLVNVWKDNGNKTNKCCGAEKYINAPNFKNVAIISDSLVAIQLNQTKVLLDRPIYIGFSILELAKSHLYKFHYRVMKRIYTNKIQLCYTDTDSLLYLIYTKDFYRDLKENIQYFDTSNYEIGNIFHIPSVNSKIPGYFKDEMGGEIITEYVGLRAKLYCITTQNTTVKKAKGIKKCITKKLDINKYKSALFYNETLRDEMCIIRSKCHKLYTQKVNKLVLSRDDDKRCTSQDNVTSLPWGHYKTLC